MIGFCYVSSPLWIAWDFLGTPQTYSDFLPPPPKCWDHSCAPHAWFKKIFSKTWIGQSKWWLSWKRGGKRPYFGSAGLFDMNLGEGEPPAERLVSQGRATPGAGCLAQFCLHLYRGCRSVGNLTTCIWFSPNFKTEDFLVLPESDHLIWPASFVLKIYFYYF